MFHLVDFSENPQWFTPDSESVSIDPGRNYRQKKPKRGNEKVKQVSSVGSKKITRKLKTDPRYALGSQTPLPDLSQLPRPKNNRNINDAVKELDSKHNRKTLLKKLINPYTLVGASALGVGTFAYLSHKHGKKQ